MYQTRNLKTNAAVSEFWSGFAQVSAWVMWDIQEQYRVQVIHVSKTLKTLMPLCVRCSGTIQNADHPKHPSLDSKYFLCLLFTEQLNKTKSMV